MDNLPIITLDTTLSDLYQIGQDPEKPSKVALVACGWSSGVDLGPGRPRNKKYLFQENITVAKSQAECDKLSPAKIREIQGKFLSLVTQRDSFGAGNMPTIFFTWDEDESSPSRTEVEAFKTFSSLAEHQRPQLLFCSKPSDLPELMKVHGIDALALKIPIDSAEELGQITNCATWSYFNSKVAIAESGLPTPKTTVFEPEFCEVSPSDCCPSCAAHPYETEIPHSCTGQRLNWLHQQISTFLSPVKARALPFVIKTQQSGGGGGTWIIDSEDKRDTYIKQAQAIILPKLFASFTSLNKDLRPATLMTLDYVSNSIKNWGLTFFITCTGEPIFLSATEQKLLDGKFWYGSSINYIQQPDLSQKFHSIMHKITHFVFHSQLPGHQYFGPIGADILETPPADHLPPSDSNYLIVDLNVRIPGSFNLSLLSSYFTSRPQQPLTLASNQFITTSIDRETFIQQFQPEIYATKAIVIMAWYFDPVTSTSHAGLVVAARSGDELEDLQERVRRVTREWRLE